MFKLTEVANRLKALPGPTGDDYDAARSLWATLQALEDSSTETDSVEYSTTLNAVKNLAKFWGLI